MPPRWSRKPDRQDPDYRKLEDRINFAVHTAACLMVNSGLWFFHNLYHADWSWLMAFSGVWAGILALHFLYIVAIADYSVKSNG